MADGQMKYEIPGEMRDFAEKGVDQARKAFDSFLGAANKAVETLQGSSNTMQSSATEATKKTLSFAEQNISAAFDHAKQLVRAPDVQEALKLQVEFARAQMTALQSQLKELGEMAQSAAKTATTQAQEAAKSAAADASEAAKRMTNS